jgi:glycosyltransferase involved in cell wall biosynthesis
LDLVRKSFADATLPSGDGNTPEMKLLIYSHFFAPSIGGVENIVLSLARGLAELRDSNGALQFETTLVTQTPAGNYADAALPFRVVRQPSLVRLWRAIREADVIHIAGPALLPMVLGFLARRPVAIEHHGYQAICPNGLLLHEPDGSICPGHFQAKHYGECWRCQRSELSSLRTLISLLLMFPRHWLSRKAAVNLAISHHVMVRHSLPRSSVVYYGIDDPMEEGSVFSPPEASAKLCFAYVGRLVPEKGIPVLLQAAVMLRNEAHEFEVRLIGDGPLRAELEALIQQKGLASCVRITGYLTGAPLVEALRDVRVVVMPSVWEETAGLAAIEQMMRGRLVITSKIGGLAEVVDEAGLTFPAGDAQALAECMQRVLQDPSIIESVGRTARDRALRFFRRERMIESHARVYREAFESGNQ